MLWVGSYVAFLPGQQEWIVLLVIGLLLFGRRLPEVGRAVGRTVTDFRRGLNEFKNQIDEDGSLREAQSSVRDLKRAVDVPRMARDPKSLFNKLTDESLASPAPAKAEPQIEASADSKPDSEPEPGPPPATP